jgi:phosphoglycerate dehydrogenase-like enzyme
MRAALPLAIAVTCVFACAGLLHVSGRLGRARVAATFALAVMIVLSPAMDSGRSRRRAAVPMHLLDRALLRAEVGSLVCPGTPEMDGLFRLASVQRLRPDLEIGRCGGK